jgi:hypothetical protein
MGLRLFTDVRNLDFLVPVIHGVYPYVLEKEYMR